MAASLQDFLVNTFYNNRRYLIETVNKKMDAYQGQHRDSVFNQKHLFLIALIQSTYFVQESNENAPLLSSDTDTEVATEADAINQSMFIEAIINSLKNVNRITGQELSRKSSRLNTLLIETTSEEQTDLLNDIAFQTSIELLFDTIIDLSAQITRHPLCPIELSTFAETFMKNFTQNAMLGPVFQPYMMDAIPGFASLMDKMAKVGKKQELVAAMSIISPAGIAFIKTSIDSCLSRINWHNLRSAILPTLSSNIAGEISFDPHKIVQAVNDTMKHDDHYLVKKMVIRKKIDSRIDFANFNMALIFTVFWFTYTFQWIENNSHFFTLENGKYLPMIYLLMFVICILLKKIF